MFGIVLGSRRDDPLVREAKTRLPPGNSSQKSQLSPNPISFIVAPSENVTKMSSWWSALNPFVVVNAETPHDEEEVKDSEAGNDESGNPIPHLIQSILLTII